MSVSLHSFQLIREMGTILGVSDTNRNQLMVADAEALNDILVRDFHHFMDRQSVTKIPVISKFLNLLNGQEWRNMRSIVSPTFSSGKMKAMFPLMKKSLENLMTVFSRTVTREIDVVPIFANFTMDVIAKVAFAVETNTHEDPNHPFVVNAKKLQDFPIWKILPMYFFPQWLLEKSGIHFFDHAGFSYCKKLAQHMVDERRRTGVKAQHFPDFLQLMLQAGKEENDKSAGGLTDEEIVANIIIILDAGFGTTSATLSFATYSLATNSHIQERVREEIRHALANSKSGELDYDILNNLPYLDAVISETLRMYPPVTFTERQCSEDYVLKVNTPQLRNREIKIAKGTGVVVPIWAVHYMEEYYPEPKKFKPERFLSENKNELVQYTFLPFAAGPRNCVGMRFALLELKLALATLVSQYQIKQTPKTKIQYGQHPMMLTPKEVVVQLVKIVS